MNKFTAGAGIIALGLLSFSMAHAGESVDKTLAANSGERVEVSHINGTIRLQGWDKNEVKVVGELSDRAKEFVFERRGSTIEISVKEDDGSWYDDDDGDNLVIHVPQHSNISYDSTNGELNLDLLTGDVEVDTINGDMSLSRITGKVRVEVINGDVDSKDITGNLKLNTVNGDVTVQNLQGDSIELETVNGDIRIDGDIDSFSANTVNGDIKLEGNTVSNLNVSSVNGDVKASIKLAPAGRISASSVGGDIRLTFLEEPQAKFSIDGHQGDIVNKLTDDKVTEERYTGFQRLDFSLGDGSGMVRASTIKGEIKISR
ncbi:DUF4097 family beta strand repeat-containing protein [Neiella marina]|uniref:DUF4097 family beta strand repeat-containing protein n=1 Tax=Neiella holothuriorum TaxID=2870530 RepID=A0ABS7EI24_9GAMM|nr:DUF4097 family beta strand repeat-containing protein [Neiella holothuriorum]MBW8191870.1 DUF4097 family beta strand repeat-containing protein [Neiella holothuriorum]